MATSTDDLALLQGAWEQVALEENGVSNPPDAHGGPNAITVIRERNFEVRMLDNRLLLAGSFTLDASTTPKSITWIDSMGEDQGKPLLASYTLDEDRFEFIAADAGQPRPTVFRTGRGQTMRSFVRVPVRGDIG